jgi:hypothetical protein
MRLKPFIAALTIAAISPVVAAQKSPGSPKPPDQTRAAEEDEVKALLKDYINEVNNSPGRDQITQVGPFFIEGGFVYLGSPWSPFRIPMPGGGASGCFGASSEGLPLLRVPIEKLPILRKKPPNEHR